MNVTEAIRNRRSIRRYRPGAAIPREDVRLMLEAAMMAPSARNLRPWEFVVVENRDLLEQIRLAMPYAQMLATASLAIIVCGRPDLQQQNGCAPYWEQDCGAAVENLLLEAVELGYGACWCGAWPVEERAAALRQLLEVSSQPLACIAVGVPDEQPKAKGFYEEAKVKFL